MKTNPSQTQEIHKNYPRKSVTKCSRSLGNTSIRVVCWMTGIRMRRPRLLRSSFVYSFFLSFLFVFKVIFSLFFFKIVFLEFFFMLFYNSFNSFLFSFYFPKYTINLSLHSYFIPSTLNTKCNVIKINGCQTSKYLIASNRAKYKCCCVSHGLSPLNDFKSTFSLQYGHMSFLPRIHQPRIQFSWNTCEQTNVVILIPSVFTNVSEVSSPQIAHTDCRRCLFGNPEGL